MVVIYVIVTILLTGVIANKEDIAKANEEVCKEGFVDAATRTHDGSTYLFRGEYYWKIHGGIVDGYPKLIKDDWKGIVSGPIDAALTWNDGSTFLFQGDNYWRYYNKDAEEGYPRKINDGFRGIPNDLDAALVWNDNGQTYFFKGSHYWRYMPQVAVPTKGKYPADISSWQNIPSNLTAAIRWEGGRTYFFKGSEYYLYEKFSNQSTPTGDAWFECAKNATILINYERERPRPRDNDANIDDMKAMMEKILIAQKENRMDMQAIMQNFPSKTTPPTI